MKKNTKVVAMLALFIALSIVGASIKIMGSIALDSMPAFLGTILLGPVAGALIGFVGHLCSAMLAGMPYGLVIHVTIGVMMAITMIAYGAIRYQPNKKLSLIRIIGADLVGLLFNTVISSAVLLLFMDGGVISILFPFLVLASILNIVFAEIIYALLPQSIKSKFKK